MAASVPRPRRIGAMKLSPFEPNRFDYSNLDDYFDALEKWAETMKGVPLGPVEEQERPYSDPDHPYYQRVEDSWKERRK